MKLDPQVLQCLEWEVRQGIRTAASVQQLQEEAERGTVAVVTLQEGPPPTSYKKDDGPPRFVEEIPFFSTGIDLTPYLRFKDTPLTPAHPPAVTVSRPLTTLSEQVLVEAHQRLAAAARDEPMLSLPPGIHERLARAVRGH